MTPAEFEDLANKTRLEDRGREVAKMVLVQGLRPAEVARRTGLSEATIRAARDAVLREMRKQAGAPPDWVSVTVIVPPTMATKIRRIAKNIRRPRIVTKIWPIPD